MRAARLTGTVTDAATGAPIAFATAIIDAPQENEAVSDFSGAYKTGIAAAGTYAVDYVAPGYLSQTLNVTLENGVTIIQDVQLDEAPRYDLTGTIVRADNGTPVAFGHVQINDGFFTYTTQANAEGVFTFEQIFEGDYSAVAGAWHFDYTISDFVLAENSDIIIELERGYQDDYLFDLGWEMSADTPFGEWERAEPVATFFNLAKANPSADLNSDYGKFAYVTGNSDLLDAVGEGTVTLTSPVMDLTIYDNPFVRYQLWHFNRNDAGERNEEAELRVIIDNGATQVTLQNINNSNSFWQSLSTYDLNDVIEITDNMRLIVEAANTDADFVVEAAIDAFRITEGNTTATENPENFAFGMSVAPNPFAESLNFSYDLGGNFQSAKLTVFDQIGRIVAEHKLARGRNNLQLGKEWKGGIYFLKIEADGRLLRTEKVFKTF